MKNIAYIRASNIYNDSRATKEIEALLENGYNIYIYGWNRDGNAEKNTNEVFKKYGRKVKLNFFDYKLKNGIGLKNINVLLKWIKWIKNNIKKINGLDCVHACDLDSAIGYNWYIKKKKIKKIYDIYDYYVDSHNIPGILKNIVEKLEIRVINKADVTIICTEERRQQIIKSKPKKLIIIHNSPNVKLLKKEKIEYDYVYCGVLCERRLLEEILTEYKNNADLKIAIAGYGNYACIAEELDRRYDNFKFFGSMKYEDVIKLESKSLTISAIYEPSIRNHKLCAPNKFYEAMALEKPIIACQGTGIDIIVKNNEIGEVIKYDAISFYKTLRKLKNDIQKCKEMGVNAKNIYDKKYKWEIMKKRLLEMYEEELK